MALYVWRRFQLQIPDEWEMLLYTRDFEHGRCTFADRYQHRLEFWWRELRRAPDFDRMLGDITGELRQRDEEAEVSPARVGEWRGLDVVTAELSTTRYGRFFAGEKCLTECVFIWPESRDRALERQVLTTIREEPLAEDGLRRWRAFGMEAWPTDTLLLTAVTAEPANAKMTFGVFKEHGREEVFWRQGWVERWLRLPLARWLALRIPKEVNVRATETVQVGDHEVVLLTGKRFLDPVARIFRQGIDFAATAWVCPVDGRCYTAMLTGAVAEGLRSPVARLTCCPRHQEAL